MYYMTHSYVWHDSYICITWLIHLCGMTHSYVWHNSFICVTWLIHLCDVAWLIHTCDITHSYVWHDSFICVTWLIHICDMTHSYVWHAKFICVTWLIHMCDMTHLYTYHDSSICMTWFVGTFIHSCTTWILRLNPSASMKYSIPFIHIQIQYFIESLGIFSRFSICVCVHTCRDETCHTYRWVMSHI